MTINPGRLPAANIVSTQFGRRQFLWTAGLGALAVGAAGGLVGCAGGGTGSRGGQAGPSGQPKPGGTLRLGGQGGAATDTLDGQNALTNTDWCRTYQLFDQLYVLDARPAAVVVGEVGDTEQRRHGVDDRGARGVTTHRGKPFGAQDILYSLNRMVANKYPGCGEFGSGRSGVIEGGQSDHAGVEVLPALRHPARGAVLGVS